MRKKGLLLLVVLIALFAGLSFLLTDQWAEKQLEKTGSAMVGAKVEIDNLDLSLLGLHARWDSLQVTDPNNTMQNMIATGRCDFDFQLLPLFSKKWIIDAVVISNMRSGVPRATDGKIEKPPEKPKSEGPSFLDKTVSRLEKEMDDAPVLKLESFTQKINVDSLIALLEIRSPDKIDSLYKQVTEEYDALQTQISKIDAEKKIDELKNLAGEIQVDQISDVNSLLSTLQTLKAIQTQADTLQNQIKRANSGVQNLVKETKTGKAQVTGWIRTDYNQALSKAQLPDINAQNVGKLIFGKKVVYQVNRVLNYTRKARHYAAKFKSDKPKKEKPPRLKGQNIYFPGTRVLPELWIKKIELSGITKGLALSGETSHISSNQKLTGFPLEIAVRGSNESKTALALEGLLNYLASPKETFSVELSRWPLQGLQLSDSPLLPYTVARGHADISSNLALTGDTLNGTIRFTGKNLAFSLDKKPANRAEELIQNVIKKTNTVRFSSKVRAVDDDMQFSIQSNLDDLIVREIKTLASKEVAAAKQRLRKEIETRTAGPKKEFDQFIAQKQKLLEDTWAGYQKTIDDEKQELENKKKDIEQRIEDEKKKHENKLKDEAQKRLNDFLN